MIDARKQGRHAWLIGKPRSANPYSLATDEALHLEWLDGWDFENNGD